MEAYNVFRDLAIIIVAAKIFAILARKCKAPQVVGEIVAGPILRPPFLVRIGGPYSGSQFAGYGGAVQFYTADG